MGQITPLGLFFDLPKQGHRSFELITMPFKGSLKPEFSHSFSKKPFSLRVERQPGSSPFRNIKADLDTEPDAQNGKENRS